MSALLTVSDIVNSNAPVLRQDTPLYAAIDQFLQHNTNGAAVCDEQGKLVGFFSAHDVMTEMWCQDYIPDTQVTIGQLMKTDVVTIGFEERLTDVMEFLALDKDQIYPTTAMGIATRLSTLSLEERVKSIKVNRPQILPVLNDGKYVGVVSRTEVLRALRTLFKEAPTATSPVSTPQSDISVA
ncbi:CBS domain-containing protein [Vibrio scophthalmi]|uniref:CBS domain-containing protein n=1 Tax=Vibrio scophthalmi TaxID=45658 RepID=UPI002FF02DD5